jgi:predicted MPP superfamily phosphohydrolase
MNKLKYIIVIILFLIGYFYYATNKIEVNEYSFESDKVDQEVTFVQITDLHGKLFFGNQEYLINKINNIDYDYLLFTGDALDYNEDSDLESFKLLLDGIDKPIYFIYGNHDIQSANYNKLNTMLSSYNVRVIENTCEFINGEIKICGVYDESMEHLNQPYPISEGLNIDDFNILLSHQPQSFEKYTADGVDLMFSGHTHGGQVRIPFIGAIVAPDQGLFPYYDEGEFMYKDARLMLSSGLGTTIIPVRTLNQPEIIVYTVN